MSKYGLSYPSDYTKPIVNVVHLIKVYIVCIIIWAKKIVLDFNFDLLPMYLTTKTF